MLNPKDILFIYAIYPNEDSHERHLLGKILIHDGMLSILEDHTGMVSHTFKEGPITEFTERKLENLKNSAYIDVVSKHDIESGYRPELIPEVESPERIDSSDLLIDHTQESKSPLFHYHRQGTELPQILEIKNSKAFLNGYELNPEELKQVLENIHSGIATLRYHPDLKETIIKTEQIFEDLIKVEPHLHAALKQIRTAVKEGHIHPDVERAIAKEVFTDTMIPSLGNKKAYQDFLSRPQKVVHVHMDMNDFGSINKVHSYMEGDRAIKSAGNSLRSAMDQTVTAKKGKLWRVSGDEFRAAVPTHEDAVRFIKRSKEILGGLSPVGGTHNFSMSVGVGHNPDIAENSLIQAKNTKKLANYPIGKAKTHMHSLFPGSEGEVSLES